MKPAAKERADRLLKLDRMLHEPITAQRAAIRLEAIGQDAIPILRTLANIETPTGGGPFTPNQGSYRYTSKAKFQNRHGAGYRGIYDFADMNASLFIQTTGQSGNILSGHYRDLAPIWQVGTLLPMTTDRSAIEAEMAGKLVLVP